MILEDTHPRLQQYAPSWWTDERVDRLTVLWNEGVLSAREIAADLRNTRNAILGKAHRLDLPARAARGEDRHARESDAHRLGLVPQKDIGPNGAISRVAPTRAHEGMKTVPISEINRILKDPTKKQLRDMLAEAVRNTAALTPAAEAS